MASFKRILVAIDSSPLAARAVSVAIELAKSLGSDLAFVNVVNPAEGVAPEGGLPAGVLLEDLRQHARQTLDTALARAEVAPPPWSFLKEGQPASEIVAAAKEWGSDLIVIGTHGRTGLRRVVLGSVAQAVVHEAPCPVLLVRS